MEEPSHMSTIILHDKKNNNWSSLGIGPLSDAINPLVTREKNGMYELTFKYPVNAPLFKELKVGRWVVADAGPTIQAQSQRLEIAEITKPINGIVTVYCEHFRYQLLRSIVKIGPLSESIPAQTALNQLKSQMEPKGDFTFFSDVATKASIDFSDPSKFKNAQEVLGGVRGSILDNFGGEYVFNNNQVRLMAQAGTEKNVIIAYGKNLTDITQEESIENTYTSVYGWAKVGNGDDEKTITLPETYLDSEYVENYTQRRIQMVDFSDKEPKDVDTLRNLIKAYIKNNNVGIPKVSIKASYVDLASSVMDDQLKNLETIDLCDWVTVAFNELEINTSAQIVKTVWNVALDRYESVELGDARTDFSKVLNDAQPDVGAINDKVDWLEKAQKEASDIIKNPGKGHVVIYPSLADPQEILIMDTTDVNTARKVWRWNAGGLGFSSTGYNGIYELAMTNNGSIVADRMTTGTLRAINIIGVSISGSTITGSTIISALGLYETEISGGTIKVKNGDQLFMQYGGSGIDMYKSDGKTKVGSIRLVKEQPSNVEYMLMCPTYGNRMQIGFSNTTTFLSNTQLVTNLDANSMSIVNARVSNKFTIGGNTVVEVFSNINMNGWNLINQSDIRLKENIENTMVDGIEEIKKLNFVEFDRKQFYKNKDEYSQPNPERELGLIAQYSPFLAQSNDKDNYLGINVNKQIMLNSLTLKQLIEIIEKQEERLSKIERILKTKGDFDE